VAYITHRAANGDLQHAPSNALSADIGSLSLEFTRLTQLSGDPKYYDAIQRIMNAFEQSQNTTRLPGLWPVSLECVFETFGHVPYRTNLLL
jgi:mannosyl-oligosaccharide alpha-1,2-mannosidase